MTKRNRKYKKCSATRRKRYFKEGGGKEKRKKKIEDKEDEEIKKLRQTYNNFNENLNHLYFILKNETKKDNYICAPIEELNDKFETIPVPGDGNCFYHAFAKGLNIISNESHTATSIRIHLYKSFYLYKKNVNKLDHTIKTYDETLKNVIIAFFQNTSLEEADQSLGTNGAWADENVIYFASFIYKVRIVVFTKLENGILTEANFNLFISETIVLHHCSQNSNTNGNHFELLKPKENVNVNNVFNQNVITNCKENFEKKGFFVFSTNAENNNSFYHALEKGTKIENKRLDHAYGKKDFIVADNGTFLKKNFINTAKNLKNINSTDESVKKILDLKTDIQIENLFENEPSDESITLAAKILNKTIYVNDMHINKEYYFNLEDYKKDNKNLIMLGKCSNNQYVLLTLKDEKKQLVVPEKVEEVKEKDDDLLDALEKMQIKEEEKKENKIEEVIDEKQKQKEKEENLKKEIELLKFAGFKDSLIDIINKNSNELLKKQICSNFKNKNNL